MVRLLSSVTTHGCLRWPGDELMALIYIRAKTDNPTRAEMLACQGGVGGHPPYSQLQKQWPEEFTFCFPKQVALEAVEMKKMAEEEENPFQHFSHSSIRNKMRRWKKEKRKGGMGGCSCICESRTSSYLKLLCRWLHILYWLQKVAFCQLIKQDLHPAQATCDRTDSFWGCCCLLAHYLPVWGSGEAGCVGILCGTTIEINSCSDTLQWDEDKFIFLFPHSHNFYTSPHKSAQAASTWLVLSKEEKQHWGSEGILASTLPSSLWRSTLIVVLICWTALQLTFFSFCCRFVFKKEKKNH